MLYESIKRRSGKSGRGGGGGDLYLSIVYERFVCGAVFAEEFPPRVIKPGRLLVLARLFCYTYRSEMNSDGRGSVRVMF